MMRQIVCLLVLLLSHSISFLSLAQVSESIDEIELLMQQKRWDKAIRILSKQIESSPDSLQLRYLRGICYAERGRFKTHLFEHWEKGSADFQFVIDRDSLFEDVFYRFGLLHRYKDEYAEALRLAHEQVRLKPELGHAEVGLFTMYRQYVYFTKHNKAIEWLERQDTDYALYFQAEAHRVSGHLEKADSLIARLFDQGAQLPAQPLLLSRARIYYEKSEPHTAQLFVEAAISTVESQRDAMFVFEDVKYILDPEELSAFAMLRKPQEYRQFFSAVWARRDPTPLRETNVRLEEHYRRLRKSEKDYLYAGFRTWFNNPDNTGELNELLSEYLLDEYFHSKGLVYIRHGTPHESIVSPDGRQPNESWRYLDPELHFHFLVSDGAVGNWRLVPVLTDPQMLEDRMLWGGTYMGMTKDQDLVRDIMARESQAYIKEGFITDRHTWDTDVNSIDIPMILATFRGDHGQTLTEIYYAMPLAEIAAYAKQDTGSIELGIGLSLHDSLWASLGEHHEKKQLPVRVEKQAVAVDVLRFNAAPGSYNFALQGENQSLNILGAYKAEIKIRDYSGTEMQVSDVILAHKIEPALTQSRFVKSELQIESNPQGGFRRGQSVFLYYEVYNLVFDADDNVQYRITYTMKPVDKQGKFLGIIGGSKDPELSLSVERTGSERSPVEFAEIDVASLNPGRYDLVVTVEDLTSGEKSSSSRYLELGKR